MITVGYKYFVTVAEELNMTKAASKLFISQQSLSSYIQRMEKQYGVELFKRKPSLRLTEAGKAMYFYAKQILKTEQSLNATFADITKNARGHLTIGMSRQRSQIFFKNIWEKYYAENKNISITIVEKNTEQLLQLLRENKIDICLGINVYPSKDLDIETLFTEKLCCSLSDEILQKYHPTTWETNLSKFQKQGIDLLDIKDLPFLLVPPENRIRVITDQFFASHGIFPHIILETNNQELILNLAESGTGIISPMYLYELWQTQPISLEMPKVYPISNRLFSNTFSIVTRKNDDLPSYAESMLKAIENEFYFYKSTVNKMNPFHLIK